MRCPMLSWQLPGMNMVRPRQIVWEGVRTVEVAEAGVAGVVEGRSATMCRVEAAAGVDNREGAGE